MNSNDDSASHSNRPVIVRDFLFELRSRCETSDNETALEITRRYIHSASQSIFSIRKGLNDNNLDNSEKLEKLNAEISDFESTCRALSHPALIVLCDQLQEMVASDSVETAKSILHLIELEHDRIRPRLLELEETIDFQRGGETTPAQTEVLVVDDDLFSRELATDLLEQEGFLVTSEESGEDALNSIKAGAPDLVLLDIDMPGLDGVQTCRQIRQLDNGEHLPIIMMTGHQDESAVERSFAARATDFAHKPLNWPVLLQRLRYIARSSHTLNDLYRTQKRLAEAQRIARIGHWDHDLSTNQLMLSDQFYEVIGYPLGSFNKFDDFLATAEEGDQNTLIEAFCNHHRSHCGECRIRTLTGDSRVIRIKGSAVYSGNNEPLWMMGTVQDVSDQRRDQEIIHR
ncbi:MAG: response regulator, partial [Immundisolibacteraceae bacterium]|nr:response regulator [Immundisolibacteraceae bacterium]